MKSVETSASRPELFEYEDYRKYLQDWFAWARTSKKMTQQRFARLAGLRTHTLVGMILRGARNLTPEKARGFKRILSLNYSEGLYFEALVRMNQACSVQEQMLALAELQSAQVGRAAHFIGTLKNAELYIKDWYVPAVRELLKLPLLPHSPELLSRAIGNKITEKQIVESIGILERMEYIRWNAAIARYEVGDQTFDYQPGKKSLVLRNYHSKILDYARHAAETQGLDDRELSTICVATNRERLQLIQQRINEFRRELHFLMDPQPGEPTDQVVLLNLQLLKLVPSPRTGVSDAE